MSSSIGHLSCEKEILHLTQTYVQEISNIWQTLFDEENIREHGTRLIEHVKLFYSDLVEQSFARRDCMLKEIKDIKEEAQELKRLLGLLVNASDDDDDVDVDVDDPNSGYPVASHNYPLLLYQAEMDRNLEIYRQQVRERREEINELLQEQDVLCEELDEMPRELCTNPLPNNEQLFDFCEYLNELKKEKRERQDRICVMRREIKVYLELLDASVKTDTEDRLLNGKEIDVTRTTLESIKRLHNTYKNKVHEQEESIQSMRRKLIKLWELLRTPSTRRLDINRYQEMNHETYTILYDELKRCEAEKSQNIKLYVTEIRNEIMKWWDKTLKSDEERKRFTNFNNNCYTEDLLLLHEMELEELTTFYEQNKEIYDLFADRTILWNRMQALEARATEPGRFNNRGGQLLKEEKERKTIASKLPKVEQQIKELVYQYEEREHMPFLVYGENIIELMANQWEMKRLEKKTAIRNKNTTTSGGNNISSTNNCGGGGLVSLSKSNFNASNGNLMGGLKNASSMFSLRPASSNNNLAVGGGGGSARRNNNNSAFKRKLNPSDVTNPSAKRTLLMSMESPGILRQRNLTNIKVSKSATNTPFKTPLKKQHKVIGTTIRRRSHGAGGRCSGSGKKRRSATKHDHQHHHHQRNGVVYVADEATPRILITEASDMMLTTTDDEDHGGGGGGGSRNHHRPHDTYASFQKSIEPCSQSSIIQDNVISPPQLLSNGMATTISSSSTNSSSRRQAEIYHAIQTENIRCIRGPKHQTTTERRSPINHHRVRNKKMVVTSSGTTKQLPVSNSRKVLSKNLPILI